MSGWAERASWTPGWLWKLYSFTKIGSIFGRLVDSQVLKHLSTIWVGNLTISEFVYAGYFAFVQNSIRISWILGIKKIINSPHSSSSFTHLKAPPVLVGHVRSLLERAWCPTVPLQLRETNPLWNCVSVEPQPPLLHQRNVSKLLQSCTYGLLCQNRHKSRLRCKLTVISEPSSVLCYNDGSLH